MNLAHLVKLQDYPTRYDRDFFHFPNHVLTLKKNEWGRIKANFEQQKDEPVKEEVKVADLWEFQKEEKKKWGFSFFRKKEENVTDVNHTVQEKHIIEIPTQAENIQELKLLFQEEWYEYQLHLSCNAIEKEKKRYVYDSELKYLIQEFSDQYLVYYKSDALLNEGSVELATIIITPLEVWVISVLAVEKGSVFSKHDKRYWIEKTGEESRKLVNPTISLIRTEKIIQHIMNSKDVSLPIKKIILSKNGYIDTFEMAAGFQYIDKRNYEEWFKKNSRTIVPLKSTQLKVGEAILFSTK